jgi:hypothetical protein
LLYRKIETNYAKTFTKRIYCEIQAKKKPAKRAGLFVCTNSSGFYFTLSAFLGGERVTLLAGITQ